MTFQKLTELLQFNWCWHLWSHALRHWGSPCAFSVSLPCLHLANPRPAVPSWPLHFYSCSDLFWVLLQETLLNAQQAAVSGDFWLCGIWGLWQSWRINYKYKSTPVVDCVVITKDLFQRCFLCPLMAVGLAIRFLLSILGAPTETFPRHYFQFGISFPLVATRSPHSCRNTIMILTCPQTLFPPSSRQRQKGRTNPVLFSRSNSAKRVFLPSRGMFNKQLSS